MSAPSSVRFERVSKAFGSVVAVREVSFEIEAGQSGDAAGPFRLRQDDDAAHDRRPGAADLRAASSSARRR